MKVLVACEESQRVCTEFRKLGHEAYSCDIIECSGGHPEWHIMQDVLPLLNGDCEFKTCDGVVHKISGKWDLIIAHPPCTDLAVSGAAWFEKKRLNGRQQKSIDFFLRFTRAKCNHIAIENPIGIMSSNYQKPNQIIQPWEFALSDNEKTIKSTCLWLKNLPDLQPIHTQKPELTYHTWIDKNGRVKRQSAWFYATRCLPIKDRGRAASKTFPGIAKAMAEQWSAYIENENAALGRASLGGTGENITS